MKEKDKNREILEKVKERAYIINDAKLIAEGICLLDALGDSESEIQIKNGCRTFNLSATRMFAYGNFDISPITMMKTEQARMLKTSLKCFKERHNIKYDDFLISNDLDIK